MNLQMFNYFLMLFAPFLMRRWTHRSPFMAALFGVVIVEYIITINDLGILYEFGGILLVYSDTKGLILDFYRNIKSAITVS